MTAGAETAAGRGRILVFDSGLGGLSVARAVRKALPDAALTYLADRAGFPYGDWTETALVERICRVIGAGLARVRPGAVVVACNTASTLALKTLRRRFDVPFVGVVPAIKTAAERSTTGIIGVLATPATVEREYTRALIDTFAFHCDVVLHGAENLARMAELRLSGQQLCRHELRTEIAPAFKRANARRTDTVVLGCTHYPLLLDDLVAAAPWPVDFIDPAPAIARRLKDVAAHREALRPGTMPAANTVLATAPLAAAMETYRRFGFTRVEILDV